jgi:hypothetical protein
MPVDQCPLHSLFLLYHTTAQASNANRVATVGQEQNRPAIRAAVTIGRPRTFGDRRLMVGFAPPKQASVSTNGAARCDASRRTWLLIRRHLLVTRSAPQSSGRPLPSLTPPLTGEPHRIGTPTYPKPCQEVRRTWKRDCPNSEIESRDSNRLCVRLSFEIEDVECYGEATHYNEGHPADCWEIPEEQGQ